LIRAPEDAKIKAKMIFSSSKDAIRRALVGIATEIEAHDPDDLDINDGAPNSPLAGRNTLISLSSVVEGFSSLSKDVNNPPPLVQCRNHTNLSPI
jgi:hypothetical protein